jgi:hypothetical protein
VLKNRYSAFISGSSPLERMLRGMEIDTILVAGTKTNVCCESTARDAMMLDFKVVLVEDCSAALSDDEHRSALENIIQQFGDVMTADSVGPAATPKNARAPCTAIEPGLMQVRTELRHQSSDTKVGDGLAREISRLWLGIQKSAPQRPMVSLTLGNVAYSCRLGGPQRRDWLAGVRTRTRKCRFN